MQSLGRMAHQTEWATLADTARKPRKESSVRGAKPVKLCVGTRIMDIEKIKARPEGEALLAEAYKVANSLAGILSVEDYNSRGRVGRDRIYTGQVERAQEYVDQLIVLLAALAPYGEEAPTQVGF